MAGGGFGAQNFQSMGQQPMQQPNFYGGFQSRFGQQNPYGGFMGFARPYQPMGWSNPYWRPQPVQPPQMPAQAQTGINGQPVSSPQSIVQQYQQMQQAQQAQIEAQRAREQQVFMDAAANAGGV